MKFRATIIALSAAAGLALGPAALASGGHNHHGHGNHNHGAAQAVTADGVGEIRAVGADGKSLVLHHEPIRALRWPAMTMELPLADAKLAEGLEKGERVTFTLQQTGPTDYKIIRVAPVQ